MIDKDKHLFEW